MGPSLNYKFIFSPPPKNLGIAKWEMLLSLDAIKEKEVMLATLRMTIWTYLRP
jgi:hypothetical protein